MIPQIVRSRAAEAAKGFRRTRMEGNPKLDFQRPRFALVGERLELASIERRQSWSDEPFFNQMIAMPNMLRAREAEEMISNATTGCGELDLLRIRNCVPI